MDAALLAAVIVGALVVIGGAVGVLVWSRASPKRTRGDGGPPPPVYLPQEHMSARAPLRPVPHAATPNSGPVASANGTAAEAVAPALALAVGAERDRGWSGDGAAGLRTRRRPVVARAPLEPAEAPASPLTGTLRMLPGRLEVVAGLDQRAEIRFVHTGGAMDQRVTLGRATGAPYEHVTLPSQTVSREHAAMSYTRDGWTITNLSTTNPVRVNGAPVDVDGAAVLLSDGDLVELGEVVLRYRI